MNAEVLGISGSPIKNSNTDRLVGTILDATGLKSEFVKLSLINVSPCYACKKCVPDNICKVQDDFQELAEKIIAAKALIIGSYPPYGQIDGFTKALLERFWSFRHRRNLLKGKLCATVLTGLDAKAMAAINMSLAKEIRDYEHMELIGQLTVRGNVPCLYCGEGETCVQSGFRQMYGPDARTSDYPYAKVEDQKEIWEEAKRIGRLVGERLH
jgi:multimeric flavodoxin WrbA